MPDDAQGGARGERGERSRRWAPLAIVAAVLVAFAIAATIALLPHRAQRDLRPGLRAVRVSNALSSRCHIENDHAEPLPYTCGAYLSSDLHVSPDAPRRAWIALSSQHDNCVIDADTLEQVVCRDTMLEWAAVDRDFASVMSIHVAGTNFVISQRHLVTGEVRQIDVPLTHSFVRYDPTRVLVVGPDRVPQRLGFGHLIRMESR